VFERDLQHARRVTLQAWRGRPWHEKVLDALASAFGPQL
jgi:cardiolipin synthase